MKTKLIIVGGFLGVGKTTLLYESARILADQGRRVGLITNDQAPGLVDTVILSGRGYEVREVSGSCFCCNFDGLLNAIDSLIKGGADTIIAEPVGSCTDISATILQPIKDKFPNISLAPFTVLVDPERIREILQEVPSELDENAVYILRKQVAEADFVLLNKIDLLDDDEKKLLLSKLKDFLRGNSVGCLCALNGDGLENWLDHVISGNRSGERIVDVDYDKYAEGEAVLGWLNASIHLVSRKKIDYSACANEMMESLHKSMKTRSAAIGHIKLAVKANDLLCYFNLTHLHGDIKMRGVKTVDVCATMTLNVRVQMAPQALEGIVRSILSQPRADISANISSLECFSPGRPHPTYRYSTVVS